MSDALAIYKGVVEDINDPLKQNRVRVRILGIHTEEITLDSTNLPWAEQASPMGAFQGIGVSSVPAQGTWVWLFFENGNIQRPVYFANSIGGAFGNELPEKTLGYKDPNLYKNSFNITNFSNENINVTNQKYKFPRTDLTPYTDVNRLASGEGLETSIHAGINASKVTKTSGALTISEPASTNNKSAYPYNTVIETKAGHVIELDDTPGNERIRIFHSSGTYEEIKPNGTKVTKNSNGHILITMGELQEIIQGEVKKIINGNVTENITGNVNLNITGDMTIACSGNFKVTGARIDLN